MTAILGLSRYRALMSALDDEQARYLLGPDLDEVVSKLGALLSRTKLPIALGQDAKIGDRIVLANSDTAQTVYVAPPVDYVFDRTGAQSNAFLARAIAIWPIRPNHLRQQVTTTTCSFSGFDARKGRSISSRISRRPRL